MEYAEIAINSEAVNEVFAEGGLVKTYISEFRQDFEGLTEGSKFDETADIKTLVAEKTNNFIHYCIGAYSVLADSTNVHIRLREEASKATEGK